jgi:hypothetical protein
MVMLANQPPCLVYIPPIGSLPEIEINEPAELLFPSPHPEAREELNTKTSYQLIAKTLPFQRPKLHPSGKDCESLP